MDMDAARIALSPQGQPTVVASESDDIRPVNRFAVDARTVARGRRDTVVLPDR